MYYRQSAYGHTKAIHHRSVNNVLWRVVAGRIRRGRGPDAARGPPVGQLWPTEYPTYCLVNKRLIE